MNYIYTSEVFLSNIFRTAQFYNQGSTQFSDMLRGMQTRWNKSVEYSITSGLKRFSLKSEVTICQCVVSVLVVGCQIVSSIIRARGGAESRVNELVGKLESRYRTLAPNY